MGSMGHIEADIHKILDNAGVADGFTIYETTAKQDVDNIILITGYGGRGPEYGIEYPSVQITVRSTGTLTARNKAYEIVKLFSRYASCAPFEFIEEDYSIEIVSAVSAPIDLGYDQTLKRHLFAINLDVIRVDDK